MLSRGVGERSSIVTTRKSCPVRSISRFIFCRSKTPPKRLYIARDGYHARHIGRTSDRRQFLLTTPFVPASGTTPGAEFIALYTFDLQGNLLDAVIDDLGPRGAMPDAAVQNRYDERLRSLGTPTFRSISVKPFSLTRFGVKFGIIPLPPSDPGDAWTIDLQPGFYMSFSSPWDGAYDT